ncbi:translation initiation factor IF-2-like [Onychomys torridus]|uniref:translation initiation factor IF-2-like n=1 Tax=Onychomys torridus TaxID=38674 RepID=UPI00167FBCCF|nr:translation initiation factor IF-2-like [Onychomys torridus]
MTAEPHSSIQEHLEEGRARFGRSNPTASIGAEPGKNNPKPSILRCQPPDMASLGSRGPRAARTRTLSTHTQTPTQTGRQAPARTRTGDTQAPPRRFPTKGTLRPPVRTPTEPPAGGGRVPPPPRSPRTPGPAALRGRPCALLRRLREAGPPARHISRSPAQGEAGRGWLSEGGLPRRGGGGAGAASELGGLGRGGAPRGGAGCPHLPRSSEAPTEAARVCPGDFPAPPDGSGRRVNAAARAAPQAPAARRRRSRARAAPSAGASPADGGAGAPQRRLLPRRPLALPAGGRGYAAGGRRGGVAPPRWPEQGARGRARGHRRTRGASGRGAPAMTSRLLSALPGPPAPGGGRRASTKTWPGPHAGTGLRSPPVLPSDGPGNPAWSSTRLPQGKVGRGRRRARSPSWAKGWWGATGGRKNRNGFYSRAVQRAPNR